MAARWLAPQGMGLLAELGLGRIALLAALHAVVVAMARCLMLALGTVSTSKTRLTNM